MFCMPDPEKCRRLARIAGISLFFYRLEGDRFFPGDTSFHPKDETTVYDGAGPVDSRIIRRAGI